LLKNSEFFVFLNNVQKKKIRSKILNKLVLGCFRFLGFGLVVGCGCERRYSGVLRSETIGIGSKRENLLLPPLTKEKLVPYDAPLNFLILIHL